MSGLIRSHESIARLMGHTHFRVYKLCLLHTCFITRFVPIIGKAEADGLTCPSWTVPCTLWDSTKDWT